MRDRHAFIAPLALVVLAAAAPASCATSSSAASSRGEKEPLVAREVVVQVKADARGSAVVTPDLAFVRSGQKLVIAVCCEELSITWKKPVPQIPKPPRCEGGECTLVVPALKEQVTVDYNVFGKCGGKEFKVDPRFVFIP